MKKRILCYLLCCSMLTLTACNKSKPASAETETEPIPISSILPQTETESTTDTKETTSTEVNPEVASIKDEASTTQNVSNGLDILSEEERQQRKENQWQYVVEREQLYTNPPSVQNTHEIFKKDISILEENSYDFSHTKICFIGDSITEGITATVDENGNFISYVNYVNESLNFERILNHGKGGRMYGTYGGEDFSIVYNFDTLVNMDSDVLVIFAGLNDYLVAGDNKRFGNVNDSVSTAGYCGELRAFMKKLQQYCSDKEIFFVLTYPVSADVNPYYSDTLQDLSLGDYISVEKQLADEYGFHTIDLYSNGFLDGSVSEIDNAYLVDSIHPNDYGYCILGRHIAAELSIYFSQYK